jgi:ribosomal protein S18 acetylase RimI-like enzyme
MTATVRPASIAEASALSELAAETFPLACTPGTSRSDIDAFISTHLSTARFEGYLSDPSRELLVAELDGTLVAYAMLVVAEPTDADVAAAITLRPTAELSKFYARSTAHGTGLATTLMACTLDAAAARGAAAVWLGVNSNNPRANRFYDKNDFAVVGRKRFHVGEREENDFVRERALSSR